MLALRALYQGPVGERLGIEQSQHRIAEEEPAASVIVLELCLGAILIQKLDLKFALIAATGLMFLFAGYLWYLSTLANPPSCGCLGLTGIFQNSRHEALLGLARNFLILWAIKWTYDGHFPSDQAAADETSSNGAGAKAIN